MKKGFTLIEIILYVAISSLMLVTVLKFFSEVIYHKNRIESSRAVVNDAQFIVQKIDLELRNTISILALNDESICIRNSSSGLFSATRIYKNGDTVRISRGPGLNNCKLAIYDERLTTDTTSVQSLSFSDISLSGARTIRYEIIFKPPKWLRSSELPGNNQSFSFSSTVVVRSW